MVVLPDVVTVGLEVKKPSVSVPSVHAPDRLSEPAATAPSEVSWLIGPSKGEPSVVALAV